MSCDNPDNFKFASYYASYMVLQQSPSKAVVWGYADAAGDIVTLTVDGQQYSTTAANGEKFVSFELECK